MRNTLRQVSISAAALALCLGAVTLALGDDGDFNPLFNGKDLSGWVTPGDQNIFSVEDGQIVGRSKEGQLKKNEFLVTDRPYKDFTLKAKVKLVSGNSGIQVRSDRAEDGAVSGPQADVADGYWGLLYEERRRGILERYPEEEAAKLVKKGDWNDMIVTCKGKRLTIDLNGTRVIDREDPEFADEGIIALQVHAGPPMEVRYKDVVIKENK